VFFRAADLPSALAYLRTMFGLGAPSATADLAAGLLYQPYYLLSFLLAAMVVALPGDTWRFTQKLTVSRAAWCAALLVLSVAALTTQSYNPFIYFIF